VVALNADLTAKNIRDQQREPTRLQQSHVDGDCPALRARSEFDFFGLDVPRFHFQEWFATLHADRAITRGR